MEKVNALVAELVDAQDLKSCFQQWKYGFDSRLGHKTHRKVGFFMGDKADS